MQDDTHDAGDTLGEMADGVKDGAKKIGHAIEDDAEQTKDDVEDVARGEDGNND